MVHYIEYIFLIVCGLLRWKRICAGLSYYSFIYVLPFDSQLSRGDGDSQLSRENG
jgi:hypothetical protein